MLNLSVLLEDTARERPERTAVLFRQYRFTYRQINEMANQVAHGLVAAGVRKGDKIAVSCPNLPYFPIVVYGILKAGAVVVPLNVLLKRREIAYHLSDSEAVGYICFEGTEHLRILDEGYAGFKEAGTCDHLWVIPFTPGAASPIAGVPTIMELMGPHPVTFETAPTRPDDTCTIIYTSGTTGRPKGAELSHFNLVVNCWTQRAMTKFGKDETILVVLPLFHSFGYTCLMHAGFLAGGTLVLHPRFEAGEVLKTFESDGITVFAGVPTMYWELLNHPDLGSFDLKKISQTLRLCTSGAAALPVEVLRQFEEKFGAQILEGYGLSETSPVASFNRLEKPRKPGSVGLPVWGVDMMIVDDEMREQQIGERGEIVIRGHNVMKGYYRHDEANDEAFRGGWFHSGDIGYKDEDGYYYIVDRSKDMIIRGGFNVYPREIEEVLMTHPAISLAAVVGIPDEEYGEEVKAYIIPKNGAPIDPAEIIAWCKKEMASYKYPRHVEIVDSLPMGPTGKILKTELRKLAQTGARSK